MTKLSGGKTALVDGDLLFFAVASAAEYGKDPDEVDLEAVYRSMETRVHNVMINAGCVNRRIFLTKGNFRHFLIGDYKANRKDSWRPECLSDVFSYAELFMGAEYFEGLEADDLMAINQVVGETVICTLDKDLQQVDGEHHRWAYLDKPYQNFVVEDGYKKLYHQLLIGDSTDGIIGCGIRTEQIYKTGAKAGQSYIRRKGVGDKTALKLLSDCASESDMFQVCLGEYTNVFGKDKALEKLTQQARLVYMVREVNGDVATMWMPPNSTTKVGLDVKTGEFSLNG